MATRRWRVLLGMASVLGAVFAPGCRAPRGPDLVAPEETVAAAPAASAPGGETVHYYAPRPPPAPREDRGQPPSPRHFWAPGYHRWDGHQHVWHPGGWYERRDGLEYIAPHWEDIYSQWEYIPGRWVPAAAR